LVEYGFRRGVSYDLLNLNPNATTAAHFLIDPIAMPGTSGSNFAVSTVGPYVCAGTMAVPRVTGGSVSVQSNFPIASLFNQLNSRFDQYNGLCDPNAAPPDVNIKPYPKASIGWMTTVPSSQAALSTIERGFRETVADLPAPPSGTAQLPANYGPLWAFARPVQWSAQPNPPGAEIPFNPTQVQWSSLYQTAPTVKTANYPNTDPAKPTPYYAGGTYGAMPSFAHWPGVQFRRVLNVPLLQCPVSGSSASVLAIGKFFMTVPATSSAIYAEFAGVTTDQQIGGPVELYR
jgi:hypothetical protein